MSGCPWIVADDRATTRHSVDDLLLEQGEIAGHGNIDDIALSIHSTGLTVPGDEIALCENAGVCDGILPLGGQCAKEQEEEGECH